MSALHGKNQIAFTAVIIVTIIIILDSCVFPHKGRNGILV
jgi:hypothetical protein